MRGVALEPLEERKMLDAAYINEIYIDPPGGSDSTYEYIELRGTPGMSLDNMYLIVVENENDQFNLGGAGEVERVIDLTGLTMGSNGFLIAQPAGGYAYDIAPGTTEISYSGVLENSGGTFMLIKNDGGPGNAPYVDDITPLDLDVGNDGLDVPTGRADWEIVDSIGIHCESDEPFYGILYGAINFGPGASPKTETYTGNYYQSERAESGLFEIEYVGRWGNSTGSTPNDWHIANLTDDAPYTGMGDFRQSAEPHGSTNVESNQNVPYGTNLTNTLGAPNLVSPTDVYINEIFFDPPASGDSIYEYIELRGTPNMSLDNYYLMFVENENDVFNTGHAGEVERVIDLNGYSVGSNGFVIVRQTGGYNYSVAPGTTELTYDGVIENSGFTAMLIKNNGGAGSAPYVDDLNPIDLDTGNDGLDVASGNIEWDIKDSIGIHSESDEPEYGILYGAVNFGPGPSPLTEAYTGNYYQSLRPNQSNFEIEYVGRWGNSTGSDEQDWHVSNLTDDTPFTNMGDFRQSADPHGSTNVESNHGVPYGTNITGTLGAPNYPFVATSIVGRHIFYNQSMFDGQNPAVTSADDNAIATDKSPYFPGGGIAPTSSMTSFQKGINGIMVDIAGTHGAITDADFVFKVGANNTPSTWAAAPAPATISVRAGAGVSGSDRVEIVWANNTIQKTWLEITVKGNDAAGGFNTNTGLAASDTFYFGNIIGDTFLLSPPTVAVVNATDEIHARSNGGFPAAVTNAFDFDRNGFVNASDQIIARVNGFFLTRINITNPPAAPAAAPATARHGYR